MPVSQVHDVIHLGHKLGEDIYRFSSTKGFEDFNRLSKFILLILNEPTLISEMCYFRIIALLFMAVRFYHYLTIVWSTSIQHEKCQCVEFGGFLGELIIIWYLSLLV